MWQTRVSYVDGAYITLVNNELGFRLFKLEISNFWFRVSNTRIAPLVGFCGALPCFDSIRRCAPLIRFCGASEFGGAILWLVIRSCVVPFVVEMWAYRSASVSSCSCNRMEVQQQRSNSSHGGGSRTTFVAPICDCGEFMVLKTATTVKNCGRQFWGCQSIRWDVLNYDLWKQKCIGIDFLLMVLSNTE